jgi:hypothetical protein
VDFDLAEARAAPEEILGKLKTGLPQTNQTKYLKLITINYSKSKI